VIKRGPDTKSECGSGGGETEGDLGNMNVSDNSLYLLCRSDYEVS
jgi:hypothetical protein